MYTSSEENYIKGIYKLSVKSKSGQVTTNDIAEELSTSPASVTDMVKKLATKKVLEYRRYQGTKLTEYGQKVALIIIRKHRLWEVFLVQKLDFNWDEVHELAEQLEHIKSEVLIDRLDEYLGFPDVDPHGDPIPNADGVLTARKKELLSNIAPENEGVVVGLADTSDNFLRYLDKIGINVGSMIKVIDTIEFDNSIEVLLNKKKNLSLSNRVAANIYLSI